MKSQSSIMRRYFRRAYRRLAMQWHPDKWTMNPEFLGNDKQKFQQIQVAYSGKCRFSLTQVLCIPSIWVKQMLENKTVFQTTLRLKQCFETTVGSIDG
ncbi:putative DnaJ domain, Chaperone J-domain superfamily [Helianthus anomalus]